MKAPLKGDKTILVKDTQICDITPEMALAIGHVINLFVLFFNDYIENTCIIQNMFLF